MPNNRKQAKCSPLVLKETQKGNKKSNSQFYVCNHKTNKQRKKNNIVIFTLKPPLGTLTMHFHFVLFPFLLLQTFGTGDATQPNNSAYHGRELDVGNSGMKRAKEFYCVADIYN